MTLSEQLEGAAHKLGSRARRDVALGPLTTYRVGGPAALLVDIEDDADLAAVAEAVSETSVPVLVVGRGSNLLVADAGFPGLAVTLGRAYAQIDFNGAEATAGAALSLPVLARRTAAAALSGLEWAVGVPGSVGGAVRMNAGGHGSDISKRIVRCEIVDLASGTTMTLDREALKLGYRSSLV